MQGLLLQPFVFSMALYFLFISFTPFHKPSVILFIIQMVFMSSDHHRITQTNSTSFSACRPLYTQHTVYLFFVKYFSLKKASEFPIFSKGFSLLSAGIMHPCA